MTVRINTTWFRDRLISKQISQRQLAKRLEMDPGALSLTLRGQRKMQLPEAEAIAGELGVPVVEVLEAAGINTATGSHDMATVAGTVDATGLATLGRSEGPRRVPTPLGMPGGTLALRYQCSDARDGWLVFYVPKEGVDSEAVGRLAVIRLEGKGGTMVRGLKRGYGKGGWNLVDVFGSGTIEGARVAAASPVLWVKTMV